MNYARIIPCDIANGEGVRTSLFVSGCTNNCPGCFNPEEQSFDYGQPFTTDTDLEVLRMVKAPMVSGLSILGGDPLCQKPHALHHLIQICKDVHRYGKSVWIWTGFVWEDIFDRAKSDNTILMQRALLLNSDVVVDGPYVESLADRSLPWRGSSNQRVIDVCETIQQGKVILYER